MGAFVPSPPSSSAPSGAVAPLALDRTAGADTIISGKRTADASVRWSISADGTITFADGAGLSGVVQDASASLGRRFTALAATVEPLTVKLAPSHTAAGFRVVNASDSPIFTVTGVNGSVHAPGGVSTTNNQDRGLRTGSNGSDPRLSGFGAAAVEFASWDGSTYSLVATIPGSTPERSLNFVAGWFVQFIEGADPAAGAVNSARLFARDNGIGKTQLCVRFPTGAVQVLATEL